MKKQTQLWTIRELYEKFYRISFPEYQREPNVWGAAAKQRLIDSCLREFDISSIYLYENDEQEWDCIDGRQRLNAIISFIGANETDEDNKFAFKIMNEIYDDAEDVRYGTLDGLNLEKISEISNDQNHRYNDDAKDFERAFWNYQLNIVELSGSRRPEEFNLQFARLNLGTIINSGEKLHAMVGDLRDACFGPGGIGQHPFLANSKIPTRRYAKEQLAAQIAAQVFSLEEDNEFTRTRHFDLQRLFKKHKDLDPEEEKILDRIEKIFDSLFRIFEENFEVLRNRAIIVSIVLLAWREKLIENEPLEVPFLNFVTEFIQRLRWQIAKGVDIDDEYRYLLDFQKHLTQASVEKPAVKARAAVLEAEFRRWLQDGVLLGDKEHQEKTGNSPSAQSQ